MQDTSSPVRADAHLAVQFPSRVGVPRHLRDSHLLKGNASASRHRRLREFPWTIPETAEAHPPRQRPRTLSKPCGIRSIQQDVFRAFSALPCSVRPLSQGHKAQGTQHAVPYATTPWPLRRPLAVPSCPTRSGDSVETFPFVIYPVHGNN